MKDGLRLIVGLGNPGTAYAASRHNVGFWVVDRLVSLWGWPAGRRQGQARIWRGPGPGGEVLLVQPQSFMNLSGEPVGSLLRFYKLQLSHVLVVHDELDFEAGLLRFKQGGGHGGHNGLRSISQHIGPDYPRLRLGIGRPPGRQSGADYVLAPVRGEAQAVLTAAACAAADAAQMWLGDGLEAATRVLHAPK